MGKVLLTSLTGKTLLELDLVEIRELCSCPPWDSISAYNTSNVLHPCYGGVNCRCDLDPFVMSFSAVVVSRREE